MSSDRCGQHAEIFDASLKGSESFVELQEDQTQSMHGSITHPYRSLMTEHGFTRCRPVSVPPYSAPEAYNRSLLRLGNGTPLWNPVGNVASPKPRVKSSIMIGDVGWFDTYGDFRYYFNIFLPRTDPAQPRRTPLNLEPIQPSLQPNESITNAKHFPVGTILVSPGVDGSFSSTEPLDATFTITAREAGILILPDGASREDLVPAAQARVRDYVLKNILDWYMFINNDLPSRITCPNGSLCVITGHDKATSWASCSARPYNITGKPRIVHYSKGDWKSNIAVSFQESSVISEYDIDHCAVFVRTMRFALSTRDWVNYVLKNEPIDIVAYHYMPTVPIFGLRAFYQTIKDKVFEEPRESEFYGLCRKSSFHPLEVVLQFLLAQSPLSNIAIVDESLWHAVASEARLTDGSLAVTVRALIKLLASHQVSVENGYVTLTPPSISSPDGITPLSTPGGLSSKILNTLKSNFQSRRQRRKIASRLSKFFPGPGVPSMLIRIRTDEESRF